MSTPAINEPRGEAFAESTLQMLNKGMTTLLVSIGHQTGLFDVMSGLPPSSADEISQATGLNDRYVREWLAGMTVSGIVEHDPSAGSYTLPAEHALCLTRAAGPDNLASFAQYVALFGELEQQIVACFRTGGGVPYSAMPRFQKLQAEGHPTGAQLHREIGLLRRTVVGVGKVGRFVLHVVHGLVDLFH